MANNGHVGTLPDVKEPLTAEIGRSGLRSYGGVLQEEFDADLRGQRAVKTFDEMRRSDPTIAAGLRAINWILGQVNWSVQPGGETKEDREAADFLDSCLHDMSAAWSKHLRDALLCLVFGWSWCEVVYKLRQGADADPPSRYDDGRVGWRKLSLIGHDSLSRWEFDERGGIQGLVQDGVDVNGQSSGYITIPIGKSVLYRIEDEKNNPEGTALALDTPIPTPDGWRTMGEIQEGDKVFDEQGKIRYVVAKSQIWEQRPCYRLTFTGGTTIIADENHLWSVTNANDRSRGNAARVMTTKQISELSGEYRRHLCCGIAPRLDGVRQVLPLSPYILGYWLGDGSRSGADISVGAQDLEDTKQLFESEGYTVAVRKGGYAKRLYPQGLRRQLNEAGVLNNKHIPEAYLLGSKAQRLALLQGLMDSDGTASHKDHYPLKWVNADPVLVEQVEYLIRSLGGRPLRGITKPTGMVKYTVDGMPIVQRRDHVALTFYLSEPAFRLKRKLARQKKGCARSYGHYLKSIESVEPQDTVCIEVDSPSHLYLVGTGMVPTHNSLLRPITNAWYIKKQLQEIEAIGIERDLTGVLIIYMPVHATETDQNKARDLLEQYKADDMTGFIAPQFGPQEHERWRFDIINSPGSKSIEPGKVIQRYEVAIARSFLAQFLMLGTSSDAGSWALSRDHRGLFETALASILATIAETMNRFLVPPLFRLNDFGTLSALPTLQPGRVSKADYETFGAALEKLVKVGLVTPDPDLEAYIRDELDLPERVETEEPETPEGTGQDEGQPATKQSPTDEETGEQEAREFAERDVELPDAEDESQWAAWEQELQRDWDKRLGTRSLREALRFARGYDYDGRLAQYAEQFAQRMDGLVADLQSGKLTSAQWEYRAKVEILTHNQQSYRVGVAKSQGVPPSQVKLSQEQRRAANQVVQEQYKYFADFAQDVRQRIKAGESLDPIKARARMYGKAAKFASVMSDVAGRGDQVLRWVKKKDDSCETCISQSGKTKSAAEWYKDGVLPGVNVKCHSNCGCSLEPV